MSYQVDRDKWMAMSIFEQMGNIGSEVSRTLKAKRAGDDLLPALTRALDLFDATTMCMVAGESPRLKEVLRSRDQFLGAVYINDDPGIEAYFMKYAIAARLAVKT